MKATTATPGHATLRPADIDPKLSPSYSPNLHAYLRARGVFFHGGGLLDRLYTVKPGTKAAEYFGAGTQMLGYICDDMFSGIRLTAALSMGGSGHPASYACGVEGLQPVEGFWDAYLVRGRCAIDPDHQDPYSGGRFHEDETGRTCIWCGHRQRKVVTARTVYDTSWVSESDDEKEPGSEGAAPASASTSNTAKLALSKAEQQVMGIIKRNGGMIPASDGAWDTCKALVTRGLLIQDKTSQNLRYVLAGTGDVASNGPTTANS